MGISVFSVAAAGIITQATFSEVNVPTTGHTFLLVTSSRSYDYSEHLEAYAAAARRSQISGTFLFLDVSTDDLTPTDLGVPSFPGVIFLKNREYLHTRFSEDSVLTFLNECSISGIPYINTESDLQSFFDSAGFAIIAAFQNASDDNLPALAETYRNHFNEISITYCDPALTGRPAFWIYRFLDNELIEMSETLYSTTESQIERILRGYAVPDILKADVPTTQSIRERFPRLAVMVLNFESGFYLSADQADFGKRISEVCEIPVLYEPANISGVTSRYFSFPEFVQANELRIIDFESGRRFRFSGPWTIENATQFCRDAAAGNWPQYYRSAPVPEIENASIAHLVSLNVREFVRVGWSAVVFYDGDDRCLEVAIAARRTVSPSVRFGAFSLAENEWPGQERIDWEKLPRVAVFRDGEMVAEEGQETSPERVADFISRAVNERDL
jgi:hypothetical protein